MVTKNVSKIFLVVAVVVMIILFFCVAVCSAEKRIIMVVAFDDFPKLQSAKVRVSDAFGSVVYETSQSDGFSFLAVVRGEYDLYSDAAYCNVEYELPVRSEICIDSVPVAFLITDSGCKIQDADVIVIRNLEINKGSLIVNDNEVAVGDSVIMDTNGSICTIVAPEGESYVQIYNN